MKEVKRTHRFAIQSQHDSFVKRIEEAVMSRGGFYGIDSDPADVGAALSVIREARGLEDEPKPESEGLDSSNQSPSEPEVVKVKVEPTKFHLPPPPTGKYLTSTLLTNATSLYGHSPQDIYESIFSPESIESDLTNALESLTPDYVEFAIGISRTGSIGLNPRGTLRFKFKVRDFHRGFAINVKAMTPSGPFDVGGPGGRFNGRIDSDEFAANFKSEYCSKRAMFSGIGMGIGVLRRLYSLCYTGGGMV